MSICTYLNCWLKYFNYKKTTFRLTRLDMEAIKKKMQAMKVEKDNAMDRADACEEASKAAK